MIEARTLLHEIVLVSYMQSIEYRITDELY